MAPNGGADPEDEAAPKPWVSWRVYVDRIFEEKERNLALAFRAAQDNLTLLAKGSEDALRLAAHNVAEKMNELNNLRREYTEDRNLLVTKTQYEALEARVSRTEGFQNRAIGVGLVVVAISAIAGAFVGRLFH